MTKREEVEAELAKELDIVISTNGEDWWFKGKTGYAEHHLCKAGKDALVSREIRVRELEAAIKTFQLERGRHDGEHEFSLTVCAKCEESYVGTESVLDQMVKS